MSERDEQARQPEDPDRPDESGEPDEAGEPDESGEPDEPQTLAAGLRHMLAVLSQRAAAHENVGAWVAAWMPVWGAARQLVATLSELAHHAGEAVADPDKRGHVLEDEGVEALKAQARRLYQAFPDASAVFFGIDNVDTLVRDTLENAESQAAVTSFALLLEERIDALVGLAVDRAFQREIPELDPERLQRFLVRLERILQEILDRWVVPAINDAQFGNEE